MDWLGHGTVKISLNLEYLRWKEVKEDSKIDDIALHYNNVADSQTMTSV